MATPTDPKDQTAAAKSPANLRASRSGRFEIDLGERLSDLDSPQGMAYAANDLEHPQSHVFALMCRPDAYCRIDTAHRLTRLADHGLLGLTGHDVVESPDRGGQCVVFVLERPAGGRLMNLGAAETTPFDEKTIAEVILPPLLSGLKCLRERRITHRAVRPNNLFYIDPGRNSVALGECVSGPPGSDQPVAFEPIERASASPTGRGEGKPTCDMYALGVTVLSLLTGRLPSAEFVADQLLERIDRGSYAAVAQYPRCSDAMRELLAGLLYDHAEGRWAIEDVQSWINGRRGGSRPPPKFAEGVRPYKFLGRDYTSKRAVALALSQNTEAARQALKEDRLITWLARSCGEVDMADAVASITGARTDESGKWELGLIDGTTIAAVCAALDPTGPVRYRDEAIMLDGFGPALASAVMSKSDATVKTIEQIISNGLPFHAIRNDPSAARRQHEEATFRAFQGFVKSPAIDAGIERCAYEMAPDMPCRSPQLHNVLVFSLSELLLGLDRLASHGKIPSGRPRDRHVSAYIASQLPINDRQRATTAGKEAPPGCAEAISDLALFAQVQKQQKVGPLRHLARWMASRLRPAIDGFHSRSRRNRIETNLNNTIGSGDLSALLQLVNDRRERRLDEQEFAQAAGRYNAYVATLSSLQSMLGRCRGLAILHGRRASMGIAMVFLLLVCISAMSGGMF